METTEMKEHKKCMHKKQNVNDYMPNRHAIEDA